MSLKIASYMLYLAADPDRRAQHQADPAATMTAFGLTAAEQTVIETNDPQQIRNAVAQVNADIGRVLLITL